MQLGSSLPAWFAVGAACVGLRLPGLGRVSYFGGGQDIISNWTALCPTRHLHSCNDGNDATMCHSTEQANGRTLTITYPCAAGLTGVAVHNRRCAPRVAPA